MLKQTCIPGIRIPFDSGINPILVMVHNPFYMFLDSIRQCFVEDCYVIFKRDMGLQFSILGMSLTGFNITVILASWNEVGTSFSFIHHNSQMGTQNYQTILLHFPSKFTFILLYSFSPVLISNTTQLMTASYFMENRGVIKRELPHFPHPELPSLSASFAMVDCSLLEILPSGGHYDTALVWIPSCLRDCPFSTRSLNVGVPQGSVLCSFLLFYLHSPGDLMYPFNFDSKMYMSCPDLSQEFQTHIQLPSHYCHLDV